MELQVRLTVGLRQSLDLGQLGVALRSGQGAPISAGLRREGLPAGQGGVVAVAVMGGGGRSVMAGWPVSGRAARGGDDGGRV